MTFSDLKYKNKQFINNKLMDKTVAKKKIYEAPYTKKAQVELEEGLCVTGSIEPTTKSPGIETTKQDVNTDFNRDNDFSTSTWD